jgi:hypothetical protein
MSALTILGFFLPVESGERMNVGVTVLLSLTVILLLLAEELPATSEVVPLISRYYTITMVNVFISILFTCVVLTFHHHAPTPLPAWVRLVICSWLARVLRIKRSGKPFEKSKKRDQHRKKKRYSLSDTEDNLCNDDNDCDNSHTNDVSNSINNKETCRISFPLKRTCISTEERHAALRRRIAQNNLPTNGLDVLVYRAKQDEEKEHFKEEWRFAARVLNQFFMWIVLFLVVLNCFVVIVTAPTANLGT